MKTLEEIRGFFINSSVHRFSIRDIVWQVRITTPVAQRMRRMLFGICQSISGAGHTDSNSYYTCPVFYIINGTFLPINIGGRGTGGHILVLHVWITMWITLLKYILINLEYIKEYSLSLCPIH